MHEPAGIIARQLLGRRAQQLPGALAQAGVAQLSQPHCHDQAVAAPLVPGGLEELHGLALAGQMAAQGLTHARRGAGVFVTQAPTDYPIGRRVRFHQNLRAAGRLPSREILSGETRAAAPREAEALHLPPGAPVHVSEGRSLADGQPMALFRSVFPAERFPELLSLLAESGSVSAALAHYGVGDFIRASTRLTAKQATATQALHLRLREGDPILRTVGINVDSDGRPVEYGHTWFAGDRVTLVLDAG